MRGHTCRILQADASSRYFALSCCNGVADRLSILAESSATLSFSRLMAMMISFISCMVSGIREFGNGDDGLKLRDDTL